MDQSYGTATSMMSFATSATIPKDQDADLEEYSMMTDIFLLSLDDEAWCYVIMNIPREDEFLTQDGSASALRRSRMSHRTLLTPLRC